jgi:hypothetical protein
LSRPPSAARFCAAITRRGSGGSLEEMTLTYGVNWTFTPHFRQTSAIMALSLRLEADLPEIEKGARPE